MSQNVISLPASGNGGTSRADSRMSCSPFRVPIARLAAAQAAIKESL